MRVKSTRYVIIMLDDNLKEKRILKNSLKECRNYLKNSPFKVGEIRRSKFGIKKIRPTKGIPSCNFNIYKKMTVYSLSRVYFLTGTWPKFRNVKVKQFPDRVLDMSLVKRVEE